MVCSKVCSCLLALSLFGISAIGCGGGVERPPTYPVSGTVMYNGSPVAGATVSFLCDGASRAATGVTNAEGEFVLSTYAANDGAVAGVHKITVTKADPDAPAPAFDESAAGDPLAMAKVMEQEEAAADEEKKPLIPVKYADSNTSGLMETVSDADENVFVLQLAD